MTEKFVDFFDMVGQTEWNKSIQRTLIHWIGFTGEENVLDAGCGAGRLIIQLAQRAKWVTGIDSSEPMIRRASLNAAEYEIDNVSFQVANIRDLPFESESFDLIMCTDLFFLFDHPDPALEELLRICNKNGQVILVNPAATMNPWSAKSYCEKYRLRDFERDSLLAWATASARRTLMTGNQMAKLAEACGGELTHTVNLLDNMASMFRIIPKVHAGDIPKEEMTRQDAADDGERASEIADQSYSC